MELVNAPLRWLIDALLNPLRELSPWVGLLLVSALSAVAMLLVFKRTSNQQRIAQVKDQIHANLFEMRLFSDDLWAILGAQGRVLRHSLTYARLSAIPMLWVLPPMVLLIAQLQFHWGYLPLGPGQSALLTVRLTPDWPASGLVPRIAGGDRPDVRLVASAGLEVETEAAWLPSVRELSWRVGARQPGQHRVQVRLGDRPEPKTVSVAAWTGRISPLRVRTDPLRQLIYPSEAPIPREVPVESITVAYPERVLGLLGIETHWLVWYFVLSLLIALLLRKPLGVTI